jgi:hypothetical protein
VRASGLGELDEQRPDPTGSGLDKHPVPGGHVGGAGHHRGSAPIGEKRDSVVERPPLRNDEEVLGADGNPLGISPRLAGAGDNSGPHKPGWNPLPDSGDGPANPVPRNHGQGDGEWPHPGPNLGLHKGDVHELDVDEDLPGSRDRLRSIPRHEDFRAPELPQPHNTHEPLQS